MAITQEQVLSGIAANGQFRRQHQSHTLGIGLGGRIDDFFHITVQVTDNEIELRNAQCESHEPADRSSQPEGVCRRRLAVAPGALNG